MFAHWRFHSFVRSFVIRLSAKRYNSSSTTSIPFPFTIFSTESTVSLSILLRHLILRVFISLKKRQQTTMFIIRCSALVQCGAFQNASHQSQQQSNIYLVVCAADTYGHSNQGNSSYLFIVFVRAVPRLYANEQLSEWRALVSLFYCHFLLIQFSF